MSRAMVIARSYCFVTVSSRFRITLATVVHAASSAAFRRLSRADSPTPSSFTAACGFCANDFEFRVEQLAQDASLFPGRLARRGQPEGEVQTALLVGATVAERALRELARGLDVGRIVQQHERLERRVGPRAAAGALLAIRGVEGRERGGGAVRFQNVYMLRRYRSSPLLCS